jgi:hypothetical protein
VKAFKLHTLSAMAGLIAACVITVSPVALAAGPAQPQHEHGASMPAKLSLNHGKKWATDEPLRAGMGRIKGLVEPQLAAAHGGKLTAAQYAALAGKVETEIGAIVANCKLEPKADAMLHLVIGEIGAGTDAMAGKAKDTRPEQGLAHVAAAVNQYGKYFQHPGFKPIHIEH